MVSKSPTTAALIPIWSAQSYTAQERRAANQVWAAAGAYGFEPLFLARNTDGTIDFYMNCIVGLVHKYYGDALIRDIFSAWEGDTRQPMLDDMAWLYLENAAYRLELPRRPVLEALRFAHADYFFAIQYKLSRQEWMAKNQLVYTMQAARWRKVLGRTVPVMTPYESSLAAALEPENAPEPAQLKNDLLALFAKFALFDGEVRQKPALHLRLQGFWAKLATKTMPTQMVKTDRVTVEHSGAVDATGSGLAVDKRRANITLKQRAAQDRAYIESCFGRCFYPPEQLRKAEQELMNLLLKSHCLKSLLRITDRTLDIPHECDILICGKRWNQIIKLKYDANLLRTVSCQFLVRIIRNDHR